MNQQKTAITYGFYGAIVGLVFYTLLLFSGNSPWGSSSWMGSWIPGISAYFALKVYTQNTESELNSFSKLFRASIATIFFQALFVNIITALLSYVLQINSLELYRSEMLQNSEQLKTLVSEKMYEQLLNELNNISYSTLAFWDFIYKIIGGLIVSLILAGIFRKNKPIFENQNE